MIKPEILAPAGSMKAMEAAIKAGADAVYMGGSKFGARAYADNPEADDLVKAIEYVHLYGKKLYLTLNTLLKEEELDQIGDFLLPYYNAGLDGIIIQDPGVFSYVKENFPGLALHASTQMNITGVASAKMLKESGASRIVPARELSLEEIRTIKEETGLEIETFVHGALCYCYSGRCLMSSILGGRSGNRGRCAQPCRLPYEVKGNKKGAHVLSPKDLCTISLIPKLCQAGIDSFKIEGRMKNPEYVATIVSIYRKYLDQYLADPDGDYKVVEEDWQRLLEAYNRGGFTEGYYERHNGSSMMAMERPNHQGIRVGQIEKIHDGKITFRTELDIHKGDLIEIDLPGEDENITLTSPEDCKKGASLSLNARKLKILKVGYPLYRTGNPWMKQQLADHILIPEKKLYLKGEARFAVGEPARLTMTLIDQGESVLLDKNNEKKSSVQDMKKEDLKETADAITSLTVEGDLVLEAQDRPVTEAQVRKPLLQTGTSRFEFEELTIHMDDHSFLPLGAVKKLRRQGLEAMEDLLMGRDRRQNPKNAGNWKRSQKDSEVAENKELSLNDTIYQSSLMDSKIPALRISVEDKDKVPVLLTMEEVEGIYLPLEEYNSEERREILRKGKEAGKKIYYALPYVFRNNAQEAFLSLWKEIQEEQPDGVLLRNMDEFAWIAGYYESGRIRKADTDEENTDPANDRTATGEDISAMEILLDQSIYAYNQEAMIQYERWMKQPHRFTYPVELNRSEWEDLGMLHGEMILYGRIPLMVSAQCVTNSTKGCVKESGYLTMTDRYEKNFYVRRHCNHCYNTVWNGVPISLQGLKKELEDLRPASLRLHFTVEKEAEMRQIIRTFYEEWNDLMMTRPMRGDFTRGHYKRGIE